MESTEIDNCCFDLPTISCKYEFSDEALIEAIFNCPPIWNKADIHYKNRAIRPRLWREISKELNIDSVNLSLVKQRWDQIRTGYARYKARLLQSSGVVKPYRNEKLLLFLDDLTTAPKESKPKTKVTSAPEALKVPAALANDLTLAPIKEDPKHKKDKILFDESVSNNIPKPIPIPVTKPPDIQHYYHGVPSTFWETQESNNYTDEALIEAIFNRPSIWNHQHRYYKNLSMRTRLWTEITKELKIDPTSVPKLKKRWNQMRSSYLKYKDGKGKSYRYKHLLTFLDDMEPSFKGSKLRMYKTKKKADLDSPIDPSKLDNTPSFSEQIEKRQPEEQLNEKLEVKKIKIIGEEDGITSSDNLAIQQVVIAESRYSNVSEDHELTSQNQFEYVEVVSDADLSRCDDQQSSSECAPTTLSTNKDNMTINTKADDDDDDSPPPSPIILYNPTEVLDKFKFLNRTTTTQFASSTFYPQFENRLMKNQACQTTDLNPDENQKAKDKLIEDLQEENRLLKERLQSLNRRQYKLEEY